jgi:hypothetical protein
MSLTAKGEDASLESLESLYAKNIREIQYPVT